MKSNVRCLVLILCAALLLSACGKKPEGKASADLGQLSEELLKLPGAPEMLPISEKRMVNYYGIDPAVCPQALLFNCADGLRVDEIWLVEAESAEAAKALFALAEARIERLCAETENYQPDQYTVAKAGRAVQIGNSVGLFISPQTDKMAELFQAAFR